MTCLQIVGHFRSGTTLLASRLDSNHGIAITRESHFLRYRKILDPLLFLKHSIFKETAARLVIFILRKNHWTISLGAEKSIVSSCHSRGTTAAVYIDFLRRELPSVDYLGDNTPRYIFDLEYLRGYCDVKTIICRRSLASIAKSALRADSFGYGPFEIAWEYVKREKQIQRLQAVLPVSDYLVIEYENFVKDPDEVEGRLANLLSRDVSLSCGSSPRFVEVSKESHHANLTKKIQPLSDSPQAPDPEMEIAVLRTEYIARQLTFIFEVACKVKLERALLSPLINVVVSVSSKLRRLAH